MPKLRRKHYIMLIILVLLIILGRLEFYSSKAKQTKELAQVGQKPFFCTYQGGDRRIAYTQVGDDSSKPLVIFLHGSPGSLGDFMNQLKDSMLLTKVQMISVDRPGFGESSGHGRGEPSLEKQAASIRPLIEQHAGRKIILVGHSWGGPLIARMAMDYGDKLAGLIFVGASLDPELEPSIWYRYIIGFPLLSWAVPRTLIASNTELFYAQRELKLMLPLWEKVQVPYSVIQGLDDTFVPPGNADFAKEKLKNAPLVKWVIIEKMHHFVPWTHPQYIQEAILAHIEK